MPTNAKKRPYLGKEFETYVAWKNLQYPGNLMRTLFRKPGSRLALENPPPKELLWVKTQTEFARRFGVGDLGTLTDWNKRIKEEGLIKKVRNPDFEEAHIEVIGALYKRILRTGEASAIKLWMELFESTPGKLKKLELIKKHEMSPEKKAEIDQLFKKHLRHRRRRK